MPGETILLFFAASILFVFLFLEHRDIKKVEGKTKEVTGVIVEIEAQYPASAIASKWARISYYVNGSSYKSSNWIQVSRKAHVGDKVLVKYLLDEPTILDTSSKLKYKIFLYSALTLIIIGMLAWIARRM